MDKTIQESKITGHEEFLHLLLVNQLVQMEKILTSLKHPELESVRKRIRWLLENPKEKDV